MAANTLSSYNLIAAFPELDKAEQAIDKLRQIGIQGDEVSLLGCAPGGMVTTDARSTDDRNVIADAAKGTVAGALGGGFVGGLAGFLIGLALLPIPGIGPVITAGVWATTGLGAIGGGSAGSLVGVLTGAALSKERGEAYQTHIECGHVLVGVHVADPVRFEQAFDALVLSGPLSIDRYGAGAATRA